MLDKILFVFGTRPEAIKVAPVFSELKKYFEVCLCVSSQHREMLQQALDVFQLRPHHDLHIMADNQDLSDITSKTLLGLRAVLEQEKPNLVIVQGDTSTTLAASLAAFYHQIPVAHLEAGLRTNDPLSPYPEEINRQIVSRIASFHFAPTDMARDNLLKENIFGGKIFVTGNTVVDALNMVRPKLEDVAFPHTISECFERKGKDSKLSKRIILVTGHRRENFGKRFENICHAIAEIADRNPSVDVIYPMHRNPNVEEPVNRLLACFENIYLVEPLGYLEFLKVVQHCYMILTDSGGIQEEAPSFGKPVLIMREKTERLESIQAGISKLVGTDSASIVASVEEVLNDENVSSGMIATSNPYGDGQASIRIREILEKLFV